MNNLFDAINTCNNKKGKLKWYEDISLHFYPL